MRIGEKQRMQQIVVRLLSRLERDSSVKTLDDTFRRTQNIHYEKIPANSLVNTLQEVSFKNQEPADTPNLTQWNRCSGLSV